MLKSTGRIASEPLERPWLGGKATRLVESVLFPYSERMTCLACCRLSSESVVESVRMYVIKPPLYPGISKLPSYNCWATDIVRRGRILILGMLPVE